MELCDPEVEDLLGMIYTEVKSRGGIYKLHCSGNNPAPAIDRVYDYLWIGGRKYLGVHRIAGECRYLFSVTAKYLCLNVRQ